MNIFEKILSKKHNVNIESLSVENYYNFGEYYGYYHKKQQKDIFHYSVHWVRLDKHRVFIKDEILLYRNECLIYLRKEKLQKIYENR